MKNDKLYSLRTIRRMLSLAEHCISYNTPGIFRDPAKDDVLQALKEIAMQSHPIKWKKTPASNVDTIMKKVNAIITDKNAIKLESSAVSDTEEVKIDRNDNQPAELIELIDLSGVEDANKTKSQNQSEKKDVFAFSLEWALLYKHLIRHGKILDRTSLEVNASWHIFLHQLRRMQHAFAAQKSFFIEEREKNYCDKNKKPSLKINKDLVREFLLEFIGQLCEIGHINSAQVIHNYIHLAYRVLRAQQYDTTLLKQQNADKSTIRAAKESGMTKYRAGSMILGVLLAGLDLSEMLVIPEGNSPSEKEEAQKAELYFFPLLTPAFITEPIFRQPFHVNLYKKLKQNSEQYKETLAAAENILWSQIPQLKGRLDEVVFTSPRESHDATSTDGSRLRNTKRDSLKVTGLLQRLKKLTFHSPPSSTASSPRENSPRSKNPDGQSETSVQQKRADSPELQTETTNRPRHVIITRSKSLTKINPKLTPSPSKIKLIPSSSQPISSEIPISDNKGNRLFTPYLEATTTVVTSKPESGDNVVDNPFSGRKSAFSSVVKKQ